MRRDSIKATCADAAAIREVRSPLGSRIARWAPVPLRLIVGYGFMEHGFAKLGRGPEAFADILHTIGVPGPHVMAWATILTEVIGGLAVILGAFVASAFRRQAWEALRASDACRLHDDLLHNGAGHWLGRAAAVGGRGP